MLWPNGLSLKSHMYIVDISTTCVQSLQRVHRKLVTYNTHSIHYTAKKRPKMTVTFCVN